MVSGQAYAHLEKFQQVFFCEGSQHFHLGSWPVKNEQAIVNLPPLMRRQLA